MAPELGIPSYDSIDVTDPPTYESQPSYLLRLGPLGVAERRRLRPADFEPEHLEA